ncbi:MAG: hypothetical protein U0802_25390 [Candidatus Binatia bacterium]
MRMSSRRIGLALGVTALVAALASGCGSSGDGGGDANLAIWPMHPIDSRFRGSNSLGAGDVDGDGRIDYVTNYEFDQRYVVQFHPPAGVDPRLPWPTVVAYYLGGRQNGTDTETAELADLDGDGNVDIVGGQGWHTAWWEGQAAGIRIIWGPPRGEVMNPAAWTDAGRIPATIDTGHYPRCDPFDVNGDGALDVLFGGRVHQRRPARLDQVGGGAARARAATRPQPVARVRRRSRTVGRPRVPACRRRRGRRPRHRRRQRRFRHARGRGDGALVREPRHRRSGGQQGPWSKHVIYRGSNSTTNRRWRSPTSTATVTRTCSPASPTRSTGSARPACARR